ncbi:MAG TPA: hypothetical protein VFA10_16770 [Ktedonobacteraceae bacterium]|nr:hypothetical protein [Ktedonobacteraceae bacterium]
MNDNSDETAKYIMYVLDLDSMPPEAADGIEVAATCASLALSLHQVILGKSEATPDEIHYFYMEHVNDLLQFARTPATISKLQAILDILQRAKSALEQEEEAEPQLRDAWRLMRKVVSQEEVEKVPASQIELRRSGMDAIVLSGAGAWEQANQLLRSWSILEHEGQRVEYMIRYNDGHKDSGWLKLPLFYTGYGEPFLIGPALDLGRQIIAVLEKSIDLGSGDQTSFDKARYAALSYLRRYEVGGSAGAEEVTEAIIKIQDDQWRPDIAYRRSLHSEHNQQEGSL